MASEKAWDDPPPSTFFVDRMNEHTRVQKIESVSPNRYDLTKTDGKKIRVFLTDVYDFSVSDYEQLRAQHPEVDCIVSASSWNHFTTEAEAAAYRDRVSTFHIGNFMSAIHNL